MSGIGEASAILAVVDIGFKLAATLNAYVSSVIAAPDDISSLASEIDSTLSHLRSLESLITKNENTNAWDADGLELAKRSIGDCEKVVTKLRSLLQKSSFRDEGVRKSFVGSEIDVSKFERVM